MLGPRAAVEAASGAVPYPLRMINFAAKIEKKDSLGNIPPRPMKILTLTTDWAGDDHYAGIVAGFLACRAPEVRLVELSRRVAQHDSAAACFVARQCYQAFPQGSAHVVGVAPEGVAGIPAPVAAADQGQWLLGYDTPAFRRIFAPRTPDIWSLPLATSPFPELDLLIRPAVELLAGADIARMASPARPTPPQPQPAGPAAATLLGRVEYIDGYGNAFTDISRERFLAFTQGRGFEITLRSPRNRIRRISQTYDAESGELLAIFNSGGMLELAQMHANLAKSVGVRINETVTVRIV